MLGTCFSAKCFLLLQIGAISLSSASFPQPPLPANAPRQHIAACPQPPCLLLWSNGLRLLPPGPPPASFHALPLILSISPNSYLPQQPP